MADGAARDPMRLVDTDAERAVLGSMMLENSVIPAVAALCSARDFYVPAHAAIFDAIIAARKRGPVDVVTLAAELRNQERLNTVGGAQYLGEITDVIPTVAHCEAHAGIVADLAARRRTIAAAKEIESAALSMPSSELTAHAMKVVRESAGAVKLKVITGEAVATALEARYTSPEEDLVAGAVSSGIADLDALLRLGRGRLYIFAARPAMGKSALTGQIAHNVAGRGGRVVVFSEEMPALELAARWVAGDARVPARAVDDHALDEPQVDRFYEALNRLAQMPIVYDDTPGVSIEHIELVCRNQALDGPLDMVLIDYLQLLSVPKMERYDLSIGEITRRLKALSKELCCPVICVSQLNRDCENRPDKRPLASDVRDSGRIEQDADGVVLVYRDEVYHRDTADRGIAEIIVGKQRNGPMGKVRLRWIADEVRFDNCDGYSVGGWTEPAATPATPGGDVPF